MGSRGKQANFYNIIYTEIISDSVRVAYWWDACLLRVRLALAKYTKKWYLWCDCTVFFDFDKWLDILFFFFRISMKTVVDKRKLWYAVCVLLWKVHINSSCHILNRPALWLMIWWNYIYNLFFVDVEFELYFSCYDFPKTSCDFSWRRRHCL